MIDEYLSIEQIAKVLQVEVAIIRSWEKDFKDLIGKPLMKGNSRCYSPLQLELFGKIKDLMLVDLYTVKGARRRLELDQNLNSALGVDTNFKNTVIYMFNAIMQELQQAREESKRLAGEVQALRLEKAAILEKLLQEQNKTLIEFLRHKVQWRKTREA